MEHAAQEDTLEGDRNGHLSTVSRNPFTVAIDTVPRR